MNRNFVLSILLSIAFSCVSDQLRAQSGRTDAALTSRDTRTASAMYEDANGYVERKFEEYAQKQVPYDRQLEERTFRERREAATRSAEQLSARKNLANSDFYFLGLLYLLAENDVKAFDAFRNYLASVPAKGEAEHAQTARMNVISIASRRLLFEDAETFLADYEKSEPLSLADRISVEFELASAYHRANKLEQTVSHAREALNSAKLFRSTTQAEETRNRQALTNVIQLLSQTLIELDKADEAIAVLNEARRIALVLPSASLYRRALVGLLNMGQPFDSIMPIDRAEAPTTTAPELVINKWIDQTPTTLANLRGSVVLLDFWAHWCGPCIASFPRLSNWHDNYKSRGFVILGVTTYFGEGDGRRMKPDEEFAYLQQFKKRHRLPYGFAISDNTVNDYSYGVSSFPSTFLLDRKGVVRFITIGGSAIEGKVLEKMIQKLLDEK